VADYHFTTSTLPYFMEPQFITDIRRIQQAKANNKLVIFVGAGVSNNSGVPNWNSLIDSLKEELPNEAISTENDSLKIAQYYCNSRGYKEYLEKIKDVLQDGKVSYNPIHNAILDLEPSHIITTNFDDLIEQSIRPRNLQYHVIRKDSDLPYIQTDRLVVKMHGDFETGNIVLTEKDYLDYRVNFPLIDAFVKSLFASKFILFVGFSFNDYNLRFIVNYTQSLLKDDFQPVYMLVDSDVNHVVKEYYKKKGIYLVEMSEEQIEKVIDEQKIDLPEIASLDKHQGKILYKQLRIINDYEESLNLVDYLYNNLKPLEDVLPVLGDRLKNFFPKKEVTLWNLHSTGLQILSPYIKSELSRFKNKSYKFEFLRKYGNKITELKRIAYLNGIYEIDHLNLYSKSLQRRNKKNQKDDTLDLFYKCDYTSVLKEIRKLSHKKLTYTKSDIELPLILYKTGNYYDAYTKYKELSVEFWEKQKYILYFMCIYNQKNVGDLAAQDCKFTDVDDIIDEVEKIDLSEILSRCPIDKKVKTVFTDLISDKYYLSSVKTINELMLNLFDDKKRSDEGGFSINSHIALLISNVYRLINFGDINYIVCLENEYSQQCFRNGVAGLLLNHSIKENNTQIKSSKLEKIDKTNLYILLYHINYSDLKLILDRYSIRELTLSEDAFEYINTLLDNLLANEQDSINLIVNCKYFDLVQNLVFLLIKTELSNNADISKKIYDIFLKYKLYKGKHAKFSVDSCLELFKLLSCHISKNKPSKDVAVKLLTPILKREKTWWKPEAFTKSIVNVLVEEDYILDEIHDISQINYTGLSDWAYMSALYPILSLKVKEQVLDTLQTMEFSNDYFMLAKIYDKYNVPIFNVDVFERYKSMINGHEVYYSYLLLKVRNDERCFSIHEKIDEFIAESEYLKFATNPGAYDEIENIKAEWLLHCTEEDFKKLVSIPSVNMKVKDAFEKERFGESLRKKFLKYA